MKAYLGLGSNIGNRLRNLQSVLDHLNVVTGISLEAVSPVYETNPIGGPAQPEYLNAAIEIETDKCPEKLLKHCLDIEKKMGRYRRERWEPRIIDIDVLLYGKLILNSPNLVIPHPFMHERAFVLQPLADIAPDIVHPVLGLTVNEMLARIEKSGITKAYSLKFTAK